MTADAPSIYTIDGMLQEPVYDTANISVPVLSTDFNYTAVEDMAQMFKATQGVVQANSLAPNTILLSLPVPGATNPEAAILDLVGKFNYLGPRDPDDPLSSVLGMYGDIEGIPPAPGSPAADLNFYLFIDPVTQWVEGGAVIGDIYYHFETLEDGALVITAYPFEVGLCRLEEARALPDPGPGFKKNMTREEWRAYKQGVKEQKKLGREQKKADTKAAREGKREEKQEGKTVRRLPDDHAHEHDNGHDHGHNHGHDHHHDHAGMHRQLQTSRLLVFIDFAPPSGLYFPWNGGNFISITQCSTTVLTQAVRDQIVAGTNEDFAPFNIVVVDMDGLAPCCFISPSLRRLTPPAPPTHPPTHTYIHTHPPTQPQRFKQNRSRPTAPPTLPRRAARWPSTLWFLPRESCQEATPAGSPILIRESR